MKIVPIDHRYRPEHVSQFGGRPSGRHVRCGKCASMINGGQVAVDDGPYPANDKFGCYHVYCRAYCPHCKHLIIWPEASNAYGVRVDPCRPIDRPAYLKTKRGVERFLRKHPEAAGVVVE